ncbi:unnamed protein product [Sphagnum balticum]
MIRKSLNLRSNFSRKAFSRSRIRRSIRNYLKYALLRCFIVERHFARLCAGCVTLSRRIALRKIRGRDQHLHSHVTPTPVKSGCDWPKKRQSEAEPVFNSMCTAVQYGWK